MQVEFDLKYLRSKTKVSKKISLKNIEKTEQLFIENPSHPKLQLKSIKCKKDNQKNLLEF